MPTDNPFEKVENGWFEIDKEKYHSDRRHDSHSSIETFRESPYVYYRKYVTRDLKSEYKDYFAFGHAVHTLILEEDKVDEEIAIAPDGIDFRTKEGKEFKSESAGKIILKQDEWKMAMKMRDRVLSSSVANDLVNRNGFVERAIQWNDPDTGLPLKVRFDKVCPEDALIIDLKTAARPGPEEFAKACANFGYHRQVAMYVGGMSQALCVRCRFLFIVIGKNEPFESFVYEIDEEGSKLGFDQWKRDLNGLAERKSAQNWGSIGQNEVLELPLPKWAFYQK